MTETSSEETAENLLGPFLRRRTAETLVLKQARHEVSVSWQGCLFFAFTMAFVLVLGVMCVVTASQDTLHQQAPMDDPALFVSPSGNHMGFLWLSSTIALCVGAPLYAAHLYNSGLRYTFSLASGKMLRNRRVITPLAKIEYLCLREERDPDDRYLYLLQMVYGDGRVLLLHNDYEERVVLNLANEIASFIGTSVRWK